MRRKVTSMFVQGNLLFIAQVSGVASVDNWRANIHIFIFHILTYISFTTLISFEIDCFMVCEHKCSNIRRSNYRR